MNIYQSIAKVQEDVDFIGKDKQVQSGGTYKYRGVDQVLNTLHPLFAKHKVFAVPEVLEIMEREVRTTRNGGEVLYQVLKVKYTFYAEDGTSVSAIVIGEAMDSGDKVSNKCMSVAYKYACFQVLSIPTEETCADPDDKNEPLNLSKPQKGASETPASKQGKQTSSGNPLGGKSKYSIIEDMIKGSDFTMDDIGEYIEGTYGEKIAINDLSELQFKKVVSTLEKNIHLQNKGGTQ